MKETISGVKVEGNWDKVVKECDEVADALKKEGVEDKIEKWEKWRPKETENFKKEIKERTIDMAVLDTNPLEESNKKISEETKEAVKDVETAITEISEDKEGALKKMKKGVKKLSISIEALARKVFRMFETVVYKYIISKTNPQYFDSNLVSASIDKNKKIKSKITNNSEEEYIMHININDEEVCKNLKNRIKELQEDRE